MRTEPVRCPELVARAAKEPGVGADAAALHLQLATPAAPTDRNVRRWNGWSTKRHAEVRAELLATGAGVEAKRAPAGRTLFLPEEWTELKAPHRPPESAELAAHDRTATCPSPQGLCFFPPGGGPGLFYGRTWV
ncbi:hypothetical protein GCM10010129_68040 [Streptomyces fumigatiscleroticus]|nr:hypothetical protein GCM10010129_68040 [Streptomyces fumigatiscleroticus]